MNEKESKPDATGKLPSFRVIPERRLVRPSGSRRHIVFTLRAPSAREGRTREPISLALVIDRSGSMSGAKLETAKSAALMVLERLGESDQASLVVFDNEVDLLIPAGPVTASRKAEARSALAEVEARANTALHEGWLTGCNSIASNQPGAGSGRLSRCFLLTDGLANVGLTDPERIAAQAAEVRRNAGIGTSTFGIGQDYNEGLLGPMAVAGSGQFHHLRNPGEIASTFAGELSELFEVAVRNLRVEVELDPALSAELVSQYWTGQSGADSLFRIDVGDLIAGEERRIVLLLRFPKLDPGRKMAVRARLVWEEAGADYASGWEELSFESASHEACDEETRDMSVMHWAGLHHAERAKKEALDLNRQGDVPGALARLDGVIKRLSEYAGRDPELRAALAELKSLRREINHRSLSAEASREVSYSAQRTSRGQRDHRTRSP